MKPNNKRLTQLLMATTAILPVFMAYGQTISSNSNEITITGSNPAEVVITEAGSITNANQQAIGDNIANGIYTEYTIDELSVDNQGEINITGNIHITAVSGGMSMPTVNQSYNGIYTQASDATLDNIGHIETNYNLIFSGLTDTSIMTGVMQGGNGTSGVSVNNQGSIIANTSISMDNLPTTGSFLYNSMGLTSIGNAVYNAPSAPSENHGLILTDFSFEIEEVQYSYLSMVYPSNNISLMEVGNGIDSSTSKNTSIIKVNNQYKTGDVDATGLTYLTLFSSSNIMQSGNGVITSSGNNKFENTGSIFVNNIAEFGGTHMSSSGNGGGINSTPSFNLSGNGAFSMHGSIANEGYISTQNNITSKKNSIEITGASSSLNYSYAINASGIANGIYAPKGVDNSGRVTTLANIKLEASDLLSSASSFGSQSLYINSSFNALQGDVKSNSGTAASYVDLDIPKIEDTNNYLTFTSSGNGVSFTGLATQSTNTGSIMGRFSAIEAQNPSNITYNNYGVLAGQQIYGTVSFDDYDADTGKITVTDKESEYAATNNYGTYVKIDEDGNVVSIRQGTSATIDGKTTVNTALVGSTDSYKVYTSETAIEDKIVNGVGSASGVVTLNGTDEFTISNSSLNAYKTALELKTTKKVSATDTYFNGGGLKSDTPVIKGDSQNNYISIAGNSYINGEVDLDAGNDIFVLDTQNTQLNGTVALGAGSSDTFALYTFTGNEKQLLNATHGYATNGDYNEYLDDRITGFENIGLETGTLNAAGNLTSYGLYVGDEATGNFTQKSNYSLKSLYNKGTINLNNNASTGTLNIAGDAYLSGTIRLDADLKDLAADKVVVGGKLSGDAYVAIKNIDQGGDGGVITLIKGDSDKSDEKFILAEENQYNGQTNKARFTGSPYVWNFKTSGSDWVITTKKNVLPPPITPPTVDPIDPDGGDTDGGDTDNGGTDGGDTDNGGSETPEVLAEVPAYTSLPTIGREVVMSELNSMHIRLGELRNYNGWVGSGSSNIKTNLGTQWHNLIGFDDSRINGWLKGTMDHFSYEPLHSFDVSGTYGGFAAGMDKKFDIASNMDIYAGIFGGYKTGSFETSGQGESHDASERSHIDMSTWSIGAYATFFNTAGTYVDVVGEYMGLSADIDAAGLHSTSKGYTIAGSVEVGHRLDLAKDWAIEPQAQVKIAHVHWNNFNDGYNDIAFENHTYIAARTGLRVEKNFEITRGEIKPWAYLGVVHEFSKEPKVTYADVDFLSHEYSTAMEGKLGLTANINNMIQAYGNIGYSSDFNDYDAVSGDIGIRVSW
ncbi:MAG: autotransporter outer membrane beta-barrel domain-containing protein [Alphaproteobacteria bacterium]